MTYVPFALSDGTSLCVTPIANGNHDRMQRSTPAGFLSRPHQLQPMQSLEHAATEVQDGDINFTLGTSQLPVNFTVTGVHKSAGHDQSMQ